MEENEAENMEGVESTSPSAITPLMTEDERRILELYDRLEELQLEIAVLKAQGVLTQDGQEEPSEEDVKKAQEELLIAKARYQLRTNIIENVLIANPILKAIHAGSDATVAEQDLLPLLEKRDSVSISLTKLSGEALAAREELKKTEIEHIILARENADLAAKMLALAEKASNHRKEDIDDPKARQQLEELEAALKVSRQRWRIMKGTASATVAGSGVDWARDPELLEIVLDDDGEEC